MGAMPEEIEPIISKLEDLKETQYAANKYYEGTYNGLSLIHI